MTTPSAPACLIRGCVRLYGCMGPPGDPTWCCEAYPQGIPLTILDGSDMHLTPQEGDDGLTFQPSASNTSALVTSKAMEIAL